MSPIIALIKNVVIIYLNHFKYFLGILSIALIWSVALAIIPVNFSTSIRLIWPIAIASLFIALFTELAIIRGFAGIVNTDQLSARKTLFGALAKLPWFIILAIIWSAVVFTGLIIFVVPGIVFATWLIFFPVIYALEIQKGLHAFKQSKQLVDGSFFPIFVRVALVVILSVALAHLAARGFEFLSSALIPEQNHAILTSVNYSVRGILSTLLQPLIPGTLVLMYYEIKKLKG